MDLQRKSPEFTKAAESEGSEENSFIKFSKLRYGYEEALEITGVGKYNIYLLITCCVLITAMGMDIFGLGIIVAAVTCDFNMNFRQIGILSSMPFLGIIVMSYPRGYFADTRGRRRTLFYAMTGSFVCALLSSLSPTWHVLALLRFICSALSSTAESAAYALLGECSSEKNRARYMLLMSSALMLSPTYYNLLGYFIMNMNSLFHPWRILIIVLAIPLGLGALMVYFCYESPKFLANLGEDEKCIEVLSKIYKCNGGTGSYPVKEVYLEEGRTEGLGQFSMKSLWTQIAPLFKPPLVKHTFLLFYMAFVIYLTNNSFVIMLPTILNVFFDSYESLSESSAVFCDLFKPGFSNSSVSSKLSSECKGTIADNVIWTGCAHGLLFFIFNAFISKFAHRRRAVSVVIFLITTVAGLAVENVGALTGLVFFVIFLTTALIVGIIASYFVDLFPTTYRGMVACLGLMIARLGAFIGTLIVSRVMSTYCSAAVYFGSYLTLTGAVAAFYLPRDVPREQGRRI